MNKKKIRRATLLRKKLCFISVRLGSFKGGTLYEKYARMRLLDQNMNHHLRGLCHLCLLWQLAEVHFYRQGPYYKDRSRC